MQWKACDLDNVSEECIQGAAENKLIFLSGGMEYLGSKMQFKQLSLQVVVHFRRSAQCLLFTRMSGLWYIK